MRLPAEARWFPDEIPKHSWLRGPPGRHLRPCGLPVLDHGLADEQYFRFISAHLVDVMGRLVVGAIPQHVGRASAPEAGSRHRVRPTPFAGLAFALAALPISFISALIPSSPILPLPSARFALSFRAFCSTMARFSTRPAFSFAFALSSFSHVVDVELRAFLSFITGRLLFLPFFAGPPSLPIRLDIVYLHWFGGDHIPPGLRNVLHFFLDLCEDRRRVSLSCLVPIEGTLVQGPLLEVLWQHAVQDRDLQLVAELLAVLRAQLHQLVIPHLNRDVRLPCVSDLCWVDCLADQLHS